VLGLREILDEPTTARREWERDNCDAAIAELYDSVWVYGDPRVYDPVREYGFGASTARKVRYTGYLNPLDLGTDAHTGADELLDTLCPAGTRMVLCAVGGGQDGAEIALAFVEAPLPPDVVGVIVTGPFMPADVRMELKCRAMRAGRVHVLEFVSEPFRLMHRADCIIAMGGYNTVCEVLAFAKPSLIVPRVSPRREQFIRARRMRDLGLLDVLPPEDLSPGALGAWIGSASLPVQPAARVLRFDGLARLTGLTRRLLQKTAARKEAGVVVP
jgi:predicted glycosyltransferase